MGMDVTRYIIEAIQPPGKQSQYGAYPMTITPPVERWMVDNKIDTSLIETFEWFDYSFWVKENPRFATWIWDSEDSTQHWLSLYDPDSYNELTGEYDRFDPLVMGPFPMATSTRLNLIATQVGYIRKPFRCEHYPGNAVTNFSGVGINAYDILQNILCSTNIDVFDVSTLRQLAKVSYDEDLFHSQLIKDHSNMHFVNFNW
jgi:hypothetical protein